MSLEEMNIDEELDLDAFDTFEDQDKKENFLNKRKPTLKGTKEEKTVRPGIKFTPAYKEELLKYKETLGATTFNGILYKLIELGRKQHIKELKKILKNKDK